jgi:hypothetical protein
LTQLPLHATQEGAVPGHFLRTKTTVENMFFVGNF